MMNRTETRIAVSSSPNPSVTGEAVSFDVSVIATVPGDGKPSGEASLYDGSLCLGRADIREGWGTYVTSALKPGTHPVTARFERSDRFQESSGGLDHGVQTVKVRGYWLADRCGAVFPFGDVGYFGSLRGQKLAAPVVAIESCGDGIGYWLVCADGLVFAFGDCEVHSPPDSRKMEAPVVGMASTSDGAGYWLVCTDGATFASGVCEVHPPADPGKTGAPVVGIASTPDGDGYWLASADGQVRAFGAAPSLGSATYLAAPVSAIAAARDGMGYWVVTGNGGVFAFGTAQDWGSMTHLDLDDPIVGIAAGPGGLGYWLASTDGGVFTRGGARYDGSLPSAGIPATDIIGVSAPL
jgi:hypothetical protein